MATFNKVYGFVEHLAEKMHNLGADQLVVALSNTAPSAESTRPDLLTANCILANVSQISYTNLSSRNLTTSTSAQSSGTYALVLADLTLTATGTVGPFRYVYIYNSSATLATNPLIGYYDYGSSITLASGETFTIDFDNVSGVLTLA
jgi:hypothetical protein